MNETGSWNIKINTVALPCIYVNSIVHLRLSSHFHPTFIQQIFEAKQILLCLAHTTWLLPGGQVMERTNSDLGILYKKGKEV